MSKTFAPNSRVYVTRVPGHLLPGTVVAYDLNTDWYDVQMDAGGLWRGLEQGDMTLIENPKALTLDQMTEIERGLTPKPKKLDLRRPVEIQNYGPVQKVLLAVWANRATKERIHVLAEDEDGCRHYFDTDGYGVRYTTQVLRNVPATVQVGDQVRVGARRGVVRDLEFGQAYVEYAEGGGEYCRFDKIRLVAVTVRESIYAPIKITREDLCGQSPAERLAFMNRAMSELKAKAGAPNTRPVKVRLYNASGGGYTARTEGEYGWMNDNAFVAETTVHVPVKKAEPAIAEGDVWVSKHDETCVHTVLGRSNLDEVATRREGDRAIFMYDEATEFRRHFAPVKKAVEPKFKVGDRVNYNGHVGHVIGGNRAAGLYSIQIGGGIFGSRHVANVSEASLKELSPGPKFQLKERVLNKRTRATGTVIARTGRDLTYSVHVDGVGRVHDVPESDLARLEKVKYNVRKDTEGAVYLTTKGGEEDLLEERLGRPIIHTFELEEDT